MRTLKILVISPDRRLLNYLDEQLSKNEFEFISCKPSEAFTTPAEGVHVAIVDRIDERPDAASLEIARLKESHAGIPIIAVSKCSSTRDAAAIRQGVFYYLAGQPGSKLLRIIRAAADALPRSETSTINIKQTRSRHEA